MNKKKTPKSNKIVYVAMPKVLMGNEDECINCAKKMLISKFPHFKDHAFFNPFIGVNQNLAESEIMGKCFEIIKKPETKAVLHIIPLPYLIDSTVTLGAISENNLAISQNKPVYVYEHAKETSNLYKIRSLNNLMKRNNLKAPEWWFSLREELAISKKYRCEQ